MAYIITTVSLRPATAAKLRREARRQRRPISHMVDFLLCERLEQLAEARQAARPRPAETNNQESAAAS
jgi:hypothetical protein